MKSTFGCCYVVMSMHYDVIRFYYDVRNDNVALWWHNFMILLSYFMTSLCYDVITLYYDIIML